MIYLIVNRKENICKIGYSNNPKKRLNELQVGNSNELQLLKTIEGNQQQEAILHSLFFDFNLRGEWFIYSNEIKKYFNIEDYVYVNKNLSILLSKCRGSELKIFIASSKHLIPYTSTFKLDIKTRKQILEDCNITNSTLNICISKLTRKNVLIKKENYYTWSGEFIIN